ncbi:MULTISPECIES: glycoside hydrolase family 2 protein [unclassified Microbacterium]|uniref:glycoside hydrolase family 2 protein n=1 Tax=unclassified Microbacterium TaxID=2609290 RepID=UPI000EA9DA40|nr:MULTISPECIES: sugar-binding domain-containing protein [unclassified Microbacterium]MBT2484037.1 glycoside hydrolase family 2 [Microbacterium sp. ISL-108]RKN69460.1 glycoside hydrolase family 2 [Microbacterium sp. CGR2]
MTLRATTQDGSYPRPRLVRENWTSLDGDWKFAYDDSNVGLRDRWFAAADATAFPLTITVPFVPESTASGIGDTGYHAVVWYRRVISARRRPGSRVILHFGAIDHEARVWVNGLQVAEHRGGQTAFSADITDALGEAEEHVVVVRAHDDPHDAEVPRGKQDWRETPHAIWYQRSTGIWRSVWSEEVADQHVVSFDSTFESTRATVGVHVVLAKAPIDGQRVRISLHRGDLPLGSAVFDALTTRVAGSIELPALRNAQEREHFLWSPERPTLLDVTIDVLDGDHGLLDQVGSYVGLRTTEVDRGRFVLNSQPYFVRSVLQQGYWPDSHLTAPSPDDYRTEVEAIRALGFNAARIHQKVEDPRFHYWADRLGLLLWGETAGAYEYTPRAAATLMSEWSEIVEQYRGHPSIVTWVPINESWGVQDMGGSRQQREFVQAIASFTRALDPSRPVVSNDGWEHIDSDIIAVHDYTTDAARLAAHYESLDAVRTLLSGHGPVGRRPVLDENRASIDDGRPLMVTEFGGISYAGEGTWGYAVVTSDEDYEREVGDLFAALHASPVVAGFCYTQLTDTMQEANGLLRADRSPKLPIEVLRALITGTVSA